MMRLGILCVCISIGEEIIAAIVNSALAKTFADAAAAPDMDTTGTVTVGIAFIFISLLCRYGAELAENKANTEHIE